MAELRLTPEASADLEEIVVYSVQHCGQPTADRYLKSFEVAFEILEQFPDSGPIYQRIVPPLRSMKCGSHRIFYKVTGDVVTVIRVLHLPEMPSRSSTVGTEPRLALVRSSSSAAARPRTAPVPVRR